MAHTLSRPFGLAIEFLDKQTTNKQPELPHTANGQWSLKA